MKTPSIINQLRNIVREAKKNPRVNNAHLQLNPEAIKELRRIITDHRLMAYYESSFDGIDKPDGL
jgi:hypothetical protein